DEIVDAWRARLAVHGLLLVPDCPGGPATRVTADRARLVQIIDALLDNAAQFADPGTVRLTIRTIGNDIDVIVTDDGPGVDHADLETIFEPFTKFATKRNSSTETRAGIGLTIVRRIADHLGGSVGAQASQSGGLEVTVRLPQLQQSEQPR
ncbi:MAG: sensor histidine kinase, partial [Actinomycetes bacterium]